MSPFSKLRAWKKSSQATGQESPSPSASDGNNTQPRFHAPSARGSSLFQEFMNSNPSNLGPAFSERLSIVSILEEKRAWSGATGYTPVEYVSRPFLNNGSVSEPSVSAPAPPPPQHSYDIAGQYFVETTTAPVVDNCARHEQQGRDLSRRSPRRMWPPVEQTLCEPETASSSSVAEDEAAGDVYDTFECPSDIENVSPSLQFDLTSRMALGLVTARVSAGAPGEETRHQSSLGISNNDGPGAVPLSSPSFPHTDPQGESSEFDPDTSSSEASLSLFPFQEDPEPQVDEGDAFSSAPSNHSWTAGDDTADSFNVVSAVPVNGNEHLVASRDGSLTSNSEDIEMGSNSGSSLPHSPSSSSDEEHMEEVQARGRSREPIVLNPGVYY